MQNTKKKKNNNQKLTIKSSSSKNKRHSSIIKDIRCLNCSSEFTYAETEGVNRCPKCATTTLPGIIKYDVDLKINWQELRILVMWASNYAKTLGTDAQFTMACIADRLRKLRPEPAAGNLTLLEDIQDIANELGINIEVVDNKSALEIATSSKKKEYLN